MINYIHQFFFKVKNKIRREKRNKNLINIPKQENNYIEIKKNLVFDPIIYTPEFIAKEAQKPEYNEELYNFLDKQFDEPYLEFVKKYYEKISQAHKTHSNYIDMIKILFVISKLIRPKNYLEVGVRRGRSMSVVAKNSPNCDMYAFDMWIQNYTGVENPGPEIVENELKKLKHKGKIYFFNGDSKKLIPKFKKNNPNIFFDLICIDGDHSYYGAKIDLSNTFEIVKIGGFLVFDDTNSFEHPYLKNVWKKNIKKRDNFICKEFNELGLGVSIAVRIF